MLIVSNNKLGALPPDISALGSLRQLVSTGRRARRGAIEPGTRGLWGGWGEARTEGGGRRPGAVSDAPGLVARALLLSSLQDVSGNELQALPAELCSLPSLRDLSVRRNQLSTLPDGEENEDLEGGGVGGECVCVYTGEVTDTLHRASLS